MNKSPRDRWDRDYLAKGDNRQKSLERTRAWQRRNPDKVKLIARRTRLKKYGITPEDYDNLFLSQGSSCKICKTINNKDRWGTFHVDHCHKTGVVRGLLCNNCNQGIGKFQDNPDFLEAAANYLRSVNGDTTTAAN